MSEMFNPMHPGRVLKNTVCREDGGISVTEFAMRLKVSRVTLSRVLNGHAGVSAELAIRLGAALGSSAQMWMVCSPPMISRRRGSSGIRRSSG